MEEFSEYVRGLDNPLHRERMEEILHWVLNNFPNLQPKLAWNQPMFTDHDTFIIGFSAAKTHMSIAPERAGIERFADEIIQCGYDHTKEIVRFKWTSPIDYSLLQRMIEINITDKANCSTFWRK